jgi:NHLM bacteriocin system ABC transporter ATP-binding protein
MEDVFHRLFENEGILRATAGNQPFLLDDPAAVWMVMEGQVDVFAVRMDGEGGYGPRSFMFEAAAGQILFGFDLSDVSREFGLLVVGVAGTTLRRIDRARFNAFIRGAEDHSEIAAPIDGFIAGMASAVSRHEHHPQYDRLLEPGTTYSIDPDSILGTRARSAWMLLEEGRIFFAGHEHIPLTGRDVWFPVARGTWFRAGEPTRLTTIETTAYLKKDPDCVGLSEFQLRFLDWLRDALRWENAAEKRFREKRIASDRRRSRLALSGLVSLVEGTRSDVDLVSGGDPLSIACLAVGKAAGITLRIPSRLPAVTATADRVKAICRASAVHDRLVTLRHGWWHADGGPLLGFRKVASGAEKNSDGRTVALLPVSPNRYELFDPRTLTRRPVDAALAEEIEPAAFSFYRPLPSDLKGFGGLLRFSLFGLGRDLRTILLVMLGGTLLGMALPVAMGYLFNTVIPDADRGQLLVLFAALVTATLAGSMFELTRNFAVLRAQTRVEASVQMALIDRLIRLPLRFFRQYPPGELFQRINAVDAIVRFLGGVTIGSIMNGLMTIGSLILLYVYIPPVAATVTAILLVNVLFTWVFSRLALKYERQAQEVSGRIAGFVLQLLTGISKLRVSATEVRAFAVWAGRFRRQQQLSFQAGRLSYGIQVYNGVMTVISAMIVYWSYASLIRGATGSMPIGDFLAFNAAFLMLMSAAMSMTETIVGLVRIVPILERVRPVLDTEPEMNLSRPDPGELRGRIEISHLSYRYNEAGPLILDDISLQVEPGEFVAVVGPSGAGKSTLLRMLLGFDKPESGAVYFDGQDISMLDITAVRRQLGVVLQSSRLTQGDLLSNIIGSASLTMDDAWEAARMAGFEADIKAMPMGMHTFISEGGLTLSGGQRQRVLIARALVARPRLILFDEATSALDNRTQSVVSESLEQLHATRIVIAHRLSTIRHADRIYVLDRGHVVQSGRFEDLAAHPGVFADLVARQRA